jgi:dUTPase
MRIGLRAFPCYPVGVQVSKNEKYAHLLLVKTPKILVDKYECLDAFLDENTDRGEKGFGSSDERKQ